MKISISQWAFPSDYTIEECCKLAKKAGFDGIELCIAEGGETDYLMSPGRIKEIKKIADDAGISFSSLATGLFWQYSLTNSSPKIVEKAKDVVYKMLNISIGLGVDTILVIPGAVNVPWDPNSEIIPYDVAYERAFFAIKEVSKEAEKCRVNIAVENVWNKVLISPIEMRDFIDKIKSIYVGSYFDVGNVLVNGYPEHWIRILGNRIKKVHFKDFKLAVGNINGFVKLLEGDVNWKEVMKAFRDIKYDNWVTGELFAQKTCPERLVYETAAVMRDIISL